MSPRTHEIEVLELRGGREQDVGVASGVGSELLDDHGEEIVTFQTSDDGVLIRGDDGGIAVVDDERPYRRIQRLIVEHLPELRHVERPALSG